MAQYESRSAKATQHSAVRQRSEPSRAVLNLLFYIFVVSSVVTSASWYTNIVYDEYILTTCSPLFCARVYSLLLCEQARKLGTSVAFAPRPSALMVIR